MKLEQKLAPINALLESRFGLRITMESIDHLQDVMAHYDAKREAMLQRMGADAAMKHPAYAKSLLISEAARLILKEIAPKRTKKRR